MTEEEKDAAAAMVKLHEDVRGLVENIVFKYLADPYGPMEHIIYQNQSSMYRGFMNSIRDEIVACVRHEVESVARRMIQENNDRYYLRSHK